MRIGSLFSGAGGLDLAVAAVFDGEILWHAEIDKAASKVLAHRFPGVPNLGDITAVGWADVPAVDVLCGGFPCQDVSAAGKRAGIKAGTRSGLWSVFADAIDALRPQWVVIENVRGLLSATAQRTVDDADSLEPSAGVVGDGAGRPVLRAIGAVLGDLCDLGYDAQWATVAASSVGAPHRRERVFTLASVADSNGERRVSQELAGGMVAAQPRTNGNRPSLPGDASDSPRDGWDEGRPESAGQQWRSDAAGDEPGVALLPTPCVVDRLATTDMTLDQWDESRRSQKERGVGSFGPRGDSLGAAVLRVEEGVVDERPDFSSSRTSDGEALLPTPTTQDAANNAGPSQYERNTLPLNAVAPLLPTPNAERVSSRMDTRLSGDGRTEPNKLGWAIAELLPTPQAFDQVDYVRTPEQLAEQAQRPNGGGARNLREVIVNELPEPTLLSTPQARDFKGVPADNFNNANLCRDVANTAQWGKYAPAIARWEQIVGPAPAPTEPNKNGNPRLSAAFSEWMMGWPAGWVTDPAIGISRNDQLRIVGNGVCPQQAVAALRFLLAVAR